MVGFSSSAANVDVCTEIPSKIAATVGIALLKTNGHIYLPIFESTNSDLSDNFTSGQSLVPGAIRNLCQARNHSSSLKLKIIR